jgi:colicin import membrane protein
MGKKSLIKSTTKKKTKSAKKDEVKKTAKKAKVTAKAKTAVNAETTAKAKAAAKTTTKTTAAAKTSSKKTVVAAKKKNVSLKDLILKKFEVWKPAEVFRVAANEEYLKNFASPPIVSGLSDKEAKRIKKLLLKKRDMATIRAEIKKETAEREAVEKAAAKKVAAEKAAAEKAAAEKAAAEKAAAEKAAAEKAAAEKAAAEKAAAEKKKAYLKTLPLKKFEAWKPAKVFRAAVDEEYLKNFASPPIVSGLSDKEAKRIKKLLLKKRDMATIRAEIKEEAVEREAAEKAAAEKAAAEREAAEKAAAEREAAEKATMKKVIIGLASGFIILVALIFSASSSNNSKYYIKEKAGVLEIWQGRYAPLGEERMMTLPGVPLPEQINAVYSKTEVFPLIFNYYIDKADAISTMSDTPDYVAIKSYLNEALLFATTGDLRKKAYSRLNDIKFNDLMYKAGVSESRGAISDLDEAMRYLGQASLLKVGAGKSDVVKQKIESIKEQKAEMIEAQVAEEATGTASVKSDVVKQKIESTKEQSAEIKTPMIEEATGSVSTEPDVVEQKIVSAEEQSAEIIEAQVAEEATDSASSESDVVEQKIESTKEQSAEIKTPMIEEATVSAPAE